MKNTGSGAGNGHVRHYLVEHPAMQQERRTSYDHLCLSVAPGTRHLLPDERHAQRHTLFDIALRVGERALLLGIEMLYCTNDLGVEVMLEFPALFEEGDVDAAGRVVFVVPAHANGNVPRRDRMLYEPNFCNLGIDIVPWAGLEGSIVSARSTAVVGTYPLPAEAQYQLFRENDPLLLFFMRNRNSFPDLDKFEITALSTSTSAAAEGICRVPKAVVDRVQRFFQTSVLPLFHYTTQKALLIKWPTQLAHNAPYPQATTENPFVSAAGGGGHWGVTLTFCLHYVVVAPRAPSCFAIQHEIGPTTAGGKSAKK